MRIFFFIFILFAVFFSNSIYAEDLKVVNLYFGNGVGNTELQAKGSQIKLKYKLKNSFQSNDVTIVYRISYNPTEGLWDLFEVAKQTSGLAWSGFWKALSGVELLPDFLQDELKNIALKFDEDRIKSNPSIQQHVDKYNEDLCEGEKVLVVAHSQGNLYANIAYTGINENVIDGFGIVSVANPSWSVAGDNSNTYYTTLDEDIVIGIIPWALGSNVNNFEGINEDDLSGHMFVKSYLAEGRKAETQILDHIITKIYSLEWPEGTCSQEYLIASTSYNYNRIPEYVIVWDMVNNKMAENIPINDGGTALFPCKKELISNWLMNGNISGTPVFLTRSPYTGTFNWTPPDAFSWKFPDDAVEIQNAERPCKYGKCWFVPISGHDNLGGYNMRDEKGNTDLSASREWNHDLYIPDNAGEGAITTGTVDIPSVPSKNTPFTSIKQMDITSLTNQGGTRRRVVSGHYTKYFEFFGNHPPDWPHSVVNFDGPKSKYTVDFKVKNPFDDEMLNISLEKWKYDLCWWSHNYEGLETRNDDLKFDFYQVNGIQNEKYIMVFYAETLKIVQEEIPCVFGVLGLHKRAVRFFV